MATGAIAGAPVGSGEGSGVRAGEKAGALTGVGAGVRVRAAGAGIGHAPSKQGSCCAGFHALCSSHRAGGAAMPWLQMQSKERDLVPWPHDMEHSDQAFDL